MAFLTPDQIREEHGLTIKEKIIPWGARWTKNDNVVGFKKGDLFKADQKLSGGSGKVEWVVIHNTGAIAVNPATTMAEQYTRATWPNQNMHDVRVHYYIDPVECWQNLREDEVGWHAGKEGNQSSLAIEIIGPSQEAENRGALLAALLLHRHGLGVDRMTTHNKWYKPKYCPLYILPHWDAFTAKVEGYRKELSAQQPSNKPGQENKPPEGQIYRVQVGAYREKGNADNMLASLRSKGFSGLTVQGQDGLYRVQAGAFSKKENALAMVKRLKTAGLNAVVL